MGDLQEDLSIAQEEGKQAILLFFEMDECPFCQRMKKTIFNQQQVHDDFKPKFNAIPIDIEGDVELIDFAGNSMTSKHFAKKIHKVRATPVMIFFDLQGQVLYRHTGAVRNATEFLQLGDYISSGAYKKQRFSVYKRQQK